MSQSSTRHGFEPLIKKASVSGLRGVTKKTRYSPRHTGCCARPQPCAEERRIQEQKFTHFRVNFCFRICRERLQIFLYLVVRPCPIRSTFLRRRSASSAWETVGRATFVALEIFPGVASITPSTYCHTASCFGERRRSMFSCESSSIASFDCDKRMFKKNSIQGDTFSESVLNVFWLLRST